MDKESLSHIIQKLSAKGLTPLDNCYSVLQSWTYDESDYLIINGSRLHPVRWVDNKFQNVTLTINISINFLVSSEYNCVFHESKNSDLSQSVCGPQTLTVDKISAVD